MFLTALYNGWTILFVPICFQKQVLSEGGGRPWLAQAHKRISPSSPLAHRLLTFENRPLINLTIEADVDTILLMGCVQG